MTQFRMLHKINTGYGQVGKLAEEFGISQPATSIMVNALVKSGFLKRVPHPTDRRQIELHLTAKANSKLEKSYQQIYANLDGKITSFPQGEKNSLTRQLREICALLSRTMA